MSAHETSKEKRMQIASRLASLHPGLEINQVGNYTSLRTGPGQLANCVVVSRTADRASFLVTRTELLDAAQKAGFQVKPVPSPKPRAFAGFKYGVWGISVRAINANEELFRTLVAESARFAESKRKGGSHA